MALEEENKPLGGDKFNQGTQSESLDNTSSDKKLERQEKSLDVVKKTPEDLLNVPVDTVSPETTKVDELDKQQQILNERRRKINAGLEALVTEKQQPIQIAKLAGFITDAIYVPATKGTKPGDTQLAKFYGSVTEQLKGLILQN